jgi:hypothetical protein
VVASAFDAKIEAKSQTITGNYLLFALPNSNQLRLPRLVGAYTLEERTSDTRSCIS